MWVWQILLFRGGGLEQESSRVFSKFGESGFCTVNCACVKEGGCSLEGDNGRIRDRHIRIEKEWDFPFPEWLIFWDTWYTHEKLSPDGGFVTWSGDVIESESGVDGHRPFKTRIKGKDKILPPPKPPAEGLTRLKLPGGSGVPIDFSEDSWPLSGSIIPGKKRANRKPEPGRSVSVEVIFPEEKDPKKRGEKRRDSYCKRIMRMTKRGKTKMFSGNKIRICS